MSLPQSVRSEVSEARREVEGLKLENEVLQKFLDRLVQEPQLNDEKADSKRVSDSRNTQETCVLCRFASAGETCPRR